MPATITKIELVHAPGDPTSDGIGQLTFNPNWNHAVRTTDGSRWVVANYYDQGGHITTFHKLWRLPPGSITPVVVYDSDNVNDHSYGMSPALETDGTSVYMIQNHYPRDGFSPAITELHKFAPPFTQTYVHTATLIGSIAAASNKWSEVMDKTRNWIWVMQWEDSPNALKAFDLTGAIVKTVDFFNIRQASDPKAWTGPELYAAATYPCMTMDNVNGIVYAGWTAESSEKNGYPGPQVQSYYNCGFIRSANGGTSWEGPNGAIVLPVSADGSGAANKQPWLLAHAGSDFLVGSDPGYWVAPSGPGQYNWNHLYHMTYSRGKISAAYGAESGDAAVFGPSYHRPYVRWDATTKAVDYRREPVFQSDSGAIITRPSGAAGTFCVQPSQVGDTYYVGDSGGADTGKLMALKCADVSQTPPVWTEYVQDSVAFGSGNGWSNISMARDVNPDGSMHGVAQVSDAPNSIYMILIEPGSGGSGGVPTLVHTFEGGVDGTDLTQGSGGNTNLAGSNFFDEVLKPAGGIVQFSAAAALEGSMGLRIATRATPGVCAVVWQGQHGVVTANEFGRTRFEVTDIPAVNAPIIYFLDNTLSIAIAQIRLLATGHIDLINAAGGTVATSTLALAAHTQYAIGYKIHPGVTGAYVTVRIYTDPNAPAAGFAEELNAGGATTWAGPANTGYIARGVYSPEANWPSATGYAYFDPLEDLAADWIDGPGSASPPSNTLPPVVTGVPIVGSVLTSTHGTWTDDGSPTYSYQWQRDNLGGGTYSDIGGATAATYTLVDADVQCSVRCVVTDTDSNGATQAASNALIILPFVTRGGGVGVGVNGAALAAEMLASMPPYLRGAP